MAGTSLVWFRNDLRIRDHSGLQKAMESGDSLIGCFHFPTKKLNDHTGLGFPEMGTFRASFLYQCLQDLYRSLRDSNIPLFIFTDKDQDSIKQICEKHQVTNLYFQEEWTRDEKEEADRLLVDLPSGITINTYRDQFLYHPQDCPFEPSDTAEIFTNFRKKLEKDGQIRPVLDYKLNQNWEGDYPTFPEKSELGIGEATVDHRSAFPFEGGETAAWNRIDYYFHESKKLGYYKKTRNGLLGTDYSSKLSAYLSLGCITARSIWKEVKRFEENNYHNQSTYWLIFELIWRDYFKYISLKHGPKLFYLKGIRGRDYQWKNNTDLLHEWIDGRTSSDFVNANMLELKNTGWMSNRGRQNVASWLAKTMEVDWRWGAAYFESQLIDYDVHSNYGNWQYVAGVGNDPRDRKFNPQIQAERYDSAGKFRKTWLQGSLFGD